MTPIYIIFSVFIISLISLVGALTLSWKKEFLQRALFVLVGLAAGALFGDAFLHLIPEAFEHTDRLTLVSLLIIAGFLAFFILEKFLHWHHHHGIEDSETCLVSEELKNSGGRIKPLGVLILTSDSIHNLVDGVIIAASFFISIEVGIATTIAVALHEIPQEIADFGLLVHSGMSRLKALIWNFATALFAVLGAAMTIALGSVLEGYVFFIGAFAAGAFIYIAGSDLVPEIQKTRNPKKSAIQFVSILVGIAIMLSLVALEDEHNDELEQLSEPETEKIMDIASP